MSWTVLLEDESGNMLKQISTYFECGSIIYDGGFKLLCYLDPYGNTTFNALQMDDLILDFEKLMKADKKNLIPEIILLAEECKEKVHTYIVFYGD